MWYPYGTQVLAAYILVIILIFIVMGRFWTAPCLALHLETLCLGKPHQRQLHLHLHHGEVAVHRGDYDLLLLTSLLVNVKHKMPSIHPSVFYRFIQRWVTGAAVSADAERRALPSLRFDSDPQPSLIIPAQDWPLRPPENPQGPGRRTVILDPEWPPMTMMTPRLPWPQSTSRCSQASPGTWSLQRSPEHPCREASRRHPKQMPEPPQLDPLHAEEHHLNLTGTERLSRNTVSGVCVRDWLVC